MKLRISILLATIVLLFSCRGDGGDGQVIDQVLRLYVKSSTDQDLLNSKIPGSYSSVALLDLLDETTADKPISGYSLLKDADDVMYLDYPAGAIRLKINSSNNDEEQIYYSQFIIKLSRTTTDFDEDIIRIEYKSSPSLFQISKLWYNNELKFTKINGKPNIVTIVK